MTLTLTLTFFYVLIFVRPLFFLCGVEVLGLIEYFQPLQALHSCLFSIIIINGSITDCLYTIDQLKRVYINSNGLRELSHLNPITSVIVTELFWKQKN